MRTRRPASVLAAALLLVLPSCSGSAPSLDEWKWRILYRDDGENRYEALYGLFRASDPDGEADLAALSVSIDPLDLEWSFNRREWTESPDEDGLWGLPPIIPNEGMRLPDERYAVRVSDLAGRSAETFFRPDPDRPDPETIEWPHAELEDGRLAVSGPYSEGELILRREDGAFLARIPVSDGEAVDFGEARSWEAWFGYEASGRARAAARTAGEAPRGFLLGPFPVDAFGE